MAGFETEQDDGSHRMRVADRYKSNAKLRKLIRPFAIIQITYICVRTVWNMLPVALLGDDIQVADALIFLLGALLFPLYQYAFGFGRSQYEKSWAIKAYAILSILLIGECFIRFWLYHVMFGPNAIDPDVAMAYPPIPKAVMYYLGYGNSASYLFRAMDLFEKSMDVAGIGACVVGLFVVKEYVSSQVEAKKQAASKSKKQE